MSTNYIPITRNNIEFDLSDNCSTRKTRELSSDYSYTNMSSSCNQNKTLTCTVRNLQNRTCQIIRFDP